MKKLFGPLFALALTLGFLITVGRSVLVDVAQAKRSNNLLSKQPEPVTLMKRSPASAIVSTTPPPIVSISVCSPNNPGNLQQGSCTQPETFDTHQIVLGPGGQSVNASPALGGGIGVVPDEHSSVYAPGTLGANQDYLFFLATGVGGNAHIGVSVLSGGAGPDPNGQWTLKLPKADGYGSYGSEFGPVFNPSTKGSQCPAAPDNDATKQDQTFDMHYASAGSIVKDPTAAPGSMLMVYEGTNACIGNAGGDIFGNNDDYISLAIATSLDYGKDWPTYRANPFFDYYPLPDVNPSQAPNNFLLASKNPMGAWGGNVCAGNCPSPSATPVPTPLPDSYGRYAVVTPTTSLASLMAAPSPSPLPSKYGEQEISGFVDDVSTDATKYLYVNWGGAKIARAALNGGSARLSFKKWNGHDFDTEEGIGGDESNSSLIPSGAFENCGDTKQNQFGSSISYVEQTHQYLLTFVCISKGDPQLGANQPNANKGGAWFWSTSYSLSPQTMHWTVPQEIEGSWSEFSDNPVPGASPTPSPSPGDGPCGDYKGYYPSFMSLSKSAGHLSLDGYVFYLCGCQPGGTPPPGRQMSSRAFKITTTDTTPPVTTAAVSGPMGLSGWYTGPTTVSFTATDDSSGVATTQYSVDGGNWTAGNSVTLTTDAIHAVQYYSIDVDENAETPKSITVMLDSTRPTITATPDPSVILNFKRVVDVTVTGKIKDNLSGVDPTTAHLAVHDEYGRVQPSGPVTIAADGSYSFTVALRTFVRAKDTDGRLYTIRVSAADKAGNSRTTETFVTAERFKPPPPPPPCKLGTKCK